MLAGAGRCKIIIIIKFKLIRTNIYCIPDQFASWIQLKTLDQSIRCKKLDFSLGSISQSTCWTYKHFHHRNYKNSMAIKSAFAIYFFSK